jgi:hypothetical protein
MCDPVLSNDDIDRLRRENAAFGFLDRADFILVADAQ